MRTSYLTIDVDFWLGAERRASVETLSHLFTVLLWALKQDNALAVTHHHQILKHANAFPADRLINIDYHSDVCTWAEWEDGLGNLNSGTWGAFIEWRQKAEFLWLRSIPDTNSIGNCNEPHLWNGKLDWKKASTKYLVPNRLTLNQLEKMGPFTGVSVALSPDWTLGDHVELAQLVAGYARCKTDWSCHPHPKEYPRRKP